MGAFESLSVTLEYETWTYPQLGRVVVVGRLDGGEPFVTTHEVSDD